MCLKDAATRNRKSLMKKTQNKNGNNEEKKLHAVSILPRFSDILLHRWITCEEMKRDFALMFQKCKKVLHHKNLR